MFEVPSEIIHKLLDTTSIPTSLSAILDKVTPESPLDIEGAAEIIRIYRTDANVLGEVTGRAKRVKIETLGNSVKFFIPIYLSNVCVNDCLYCSYRMGHGSMPRKTLNEAEFRHELEEVLGMGYRVLELVTSESPELKNNYQLAKYVSIAREMVNKVSQTEEKPEVILMSWALADDEFKAVRDAGCDAFYLWQETYDKEIYLELHPVGTPKSDFEWRIGVFERAMNAGFERVGLGVLFGLTPWEFEVLALIAHGKYLENSYGYRVDVIGIPRFKPAEGAPMQAPPYPVSDDELRLAVALYRLAFPYANVVLNTREKLNLVLDLLAGGGSEMNMACAIYPGGYTEHSDARQFEHYSYPTDKTLEMLIGKGYSPSHFVTKSAKKNQT
jgi:2-iminoacetate synthase